MIIDTVLFYNEIDMLEFRLKELNSAVDKFVIVEATQTFTGNKKQLYFKENKQIFKKYLDKIQYVILKDIQNVNAWAREARQRVATGEVLKSLNLNDKDIVIASDIDEIPDVDEISKFKKHGLPQPIITPLQDTYYYDFNHKVKAYSGYDLKSNKTHHKTVGCKIFYYGEFIKLGVSIQELRTKHISLSNLYEKGGWHLTFFMSPERIKEKMENFAREEYNGDIKKLIKDKKIKFDTIKIEDNKYLPKNYKFWL